MDSGKRHAHLGGDSPLFQAGWPSARTHGSRETGVHQKTVNRLVKFLDQFKQMNFVNDQEMEQQLESVRKETVHPFGGGIPGQHQGQDPWVNGLAQLRNCLASQDATECLATLSRLRAPLQRLLRFFEQCKKRLRIEDFDV